VTKKVKNGTLFRNRTWPNTGVEGTDTRFANRGSSATDRYDQHRTAAALENPHRQRRYAYCLDALVLSLLLTA